MKIKSQHKLRVEALLFDLGDTLIGASLIADTALLKTVEELFERKIIRDKRNFIETYRYVSEKTQGLSINHLYSDIKIITGTVDNLGLPSSPALIGSFLGLYRDTVRQSIRENTNLRSLFCRLRAQGFKIGIVTDGTTVEQFDQLYRIGILEYIEAVSISESVGVEKPDSLMFEYTLSELNVSDARQTVMIGDDLKRDIWGAANLGIKTILSTEYVSGEIQFTENILPDLVLNSVLNVADHVERCKK